MDDNTSEATSPYSTSQMENSSMHDQSNDTYQWNIRRQINVAMLHPQANQHQILQGEPFEASHQSRPGGCRLKMSEAERKRRKQQCDVRYRQNRKDKMERLSAENKHLREENERFRAENKYLKERLREQKGKEQCPEEVQQRQDSYISQSSQVDHQSAYVQVNHYGMEYEQAVYVEHRHFIDSYSGGALDEVDGLEISDLRSLLLSENEMIPGGRVPVIDNASEQPEGSQTALSCAEMAKTQFLMKLDAEVPSNIVSSDFTGLEGERKKFGRYSFPSSLIPIVQKITQFHGDVSATSLISPSVSGEIYVWFCAVIEEMGHLQLDQITENKMLKWRDVIKDAIRLNFNVTFAMEHLKKIACAYFGLLGYRELQDIDDEISKLEAKVNEWKKKRTEMYEESKLSIDAVELFRGSPVGTGLLPSTCNRIMDF